MKKNGKKNSISPSQGHLPSHRVEEVPLRPGLLHRIADAHPELSMEQVLRLTQLALGRDDDDDERGGDGGRGRAGGGREDGDDGGDEEGEEEEEPSDGGEDAGEEERAAARARRAALRQAPAMVAGMSWNLRSRNTRLPWSRSCWTTSGPPATNSSRPTFTQRSSGTAAAKAMACSGAMPSRATII